LVFGDQHRAVDLLACGARAIRSAFVEPVSATTSSRRHGGVSAARSEVMSSGA
jgi:hypothetical protein